MSTAKDIGHVNVYTISADSIFLSFAQIKGSGLINPICSANVIIDYFNRQDVHPKTEIAQKWEMDGKYIHTGTTFNNPKDLSAALVDAKDISEIILDPVRNKTLFGKDAVFYQIPRWETKDQKLATIVGENSCWQIVEISSLNERSGFSKEEINSLNEGYSLIKGTIEMKSKRAVFETRTLKTMALNTKFEFRHTHDDPFAYDLFADLIKNITERYISKMSPADIYTMNVKTAQEIAVPVLMPSAISQKNELFVAIGYSNE